MGSSLLSASVGTLGDGFETFDGFCAIGNNSLVGHPLPVLSSLPSHPLFGFAVMEEGQRQART